MSKVELVREFLLKEIARSAGGRLPSEHWLCASLNVSRPTVKKAVSALEREGLLECRPGIGSFARRQLTPGGIRAVAFLISTVKHPSSPWACSEVEKLSSFLARRGISVFLLCAGATPEENLEILKNAASNPAVIGAIVCAPRMPRSSLFEADSSFPVVFSGLRPLDFPVNFVGYDIDGTADCAVKYLKKLGHEKIGLAQNRTVWSPEIFRRSFTRALEKEDLSVDPRWFFYETSESCRQAGNECAEHFLSLDDRPTAIQFESDIMAESFITAVRDAGVRVPEDVSVLGLDNNAQDPPVPLTTVTMPQESRDERAAELLLEMFTTPKQRFYREVLIPRQLVIRASTGAVVVKSHNGREKK